MKRYSLSLLRRPRVYVQIFFLIYLAVGVYVFKDYGISWDEPSHRQIALVSAKYLFNMFMPSFQPPDFMGLPPLAEYIANHYGVIFDLPMYIGDIILGYNGSMLEAYYLRHICTFLLFYISVLCLYLIVKNRYESRAMGLMACIFLILSPRFFAESFYGKDIVFFSFFTISIYFFVRYLDRTSRLNLLFFSMSSAVVVAQRITGIIIPVLAIAMMVIEVIKMDHQFNNTSKSIFAPVIYLISFFIFLVLFWPFLWSSPLENFVKAFVVMSKYPVSYYNLYLGAFVQSTEVPWHYIPVWILITTPLIFTFFFIIGSFVIIRRTIKNGRILYTNYKDRQDFLFILLFIAPLMAVIILNAALYDGWRHMYFIYVPFLLIAMAGVFRVKGLILDSATCRERCAASIIVTVAMLCLVSIFYQIIRYHPHQNVYFNILVGDNVGQQYDLDYWGLSFRKGIEYVTHNDKRPVIKLSANVIPPLINNVIFLEKNDIIRLRLTEVNQADYFITNYRWHPQPYGLRNEVYTITVDEVKILSVFKLR